MREQDLNPAPRGRLEKVHDSNVDLFLLLAVFVTVFQPLQEATGFWRGLAIVVPAGVAALVLLELLMAPLTRRRVALDAEHGLIECAHRERGSSLKGRWAMGYAKPEPGRLLFQARTGMTGPLAGPVEIYSGPKTVSQPVKAPWTVFPRGRMIEFSTDKGSVELAASPSSLKLLVETMRAPGNSI